MADIISLNKLAKESTQESLDKINEFKQKGLKEVIKHIEDQDTVGYLMFTFDQEGNTMVTAAGQLDPADCCMALERVKYQIVTQEGGGF